MSQQEFKLRDKRQENTIEAKVEIVDANQKFQKYTTVEKYIQTDSYSLFIIENKSYHIFHPGSSDIFLSEKKYKPMEAILIPLLASYSLVSTYFNLQQWTEFGVVVYFNIADFFIVVSNIGFGLWIAYERYRSNILTLTIERKYFGWVPNVKQPSDPIAVETEKIIRRGFNLIQIILAFIMGAAFVFIMNTLFDVLLNFGFSVLIAFAIIMFVVQVKVQHGTKKQSAKNQSRVISQTVLYEQDDKLAVIEGYTSSFTNDQRLFDELLTVPFEFPEEEKENGN